MGKGDDGGSKAPILTDASYKRVVDGMRDAVIIDDVSGRIVYANRAFRELFGFEEGEVSRLQLEDYVAPQWRGELRERHRQRIRGDKPPSRFEYEGITKSGQRMWLSVDVLEMYEDDQLVGTQSAIRDMTSIKRTEQRLRRANRALSEVIEALPLPIVVLDRAGDVRIWNAAAEQLFGYTADELVGEAYPLAPGDLSDEFREMLHQATQLGHAYSGHETKRYDSRGNPIDVAIWSAPLRKEDGAIDGTMALIMDIRDRLRMQRDYRQLFETAHDAIMIFDPQTEVVYEANPRACALYGFSREELLGMSLKEISPDVKRGRRVIADILLRRTRADFETVHRRKDGVEIQIEANASLVVYQGKPAILTINRDTTRRRALERKLRQAQRMEAMGQLAGGIAHDFNNILATVLAAAEHLGDHVRTGEQRSQVEEIIDATDRGTRLARQLLTFGRQSVVRPVALSLPHVLRDMSAWLARVLEDNIELKIEHASEAAVVHSDPGQLEQVLLNLVVNARDAMPDGGTLTISTKVLEVDEAGVGTTDPISPGGYVVISVGDNGTGMTENTRQKVFDPFFTTKAEGKGTGLGLATVYSIVQQGHGGIRIRSKLGEGTNFDVFLPRSRDVPRDAGESPAPVAAAPSPRPPEREARVETILLVEDNPGLRLALRRQLRAGGWEVIAAASAAEALNEFAKRGDDVDLLLTDVLMPGKSGPELARALRGERPELPVLFMSGFVDDARRAEIGDDPVVQKPVTRAALSAEIRALLDGEL